MTDIIDFESEKERHDNPEWARIEEGLFAAIQRHLDSLRMLSLNQDKFDHMEACVKRMVEFLQECGCSDIKTEVRRGSLSFGNWGASFSIYGISVVDMKEFCDILCMADGIDIDINMNTTRVELTLTFRDVETPIYK